MVALPVSVTERGEVIERLGVRLAGLLLGQARQNDR